MKCTFDYDVPTTREINIPKRFEFVYDGTPEEDYSDEQLELIDEWYDKILPKKLGIDHLPYPIHTCQANCTHIERD